MLRWSTIPFLAILIAAPVAAQTTPLVMQPETAVVGPGGVDMVTGIYRDERTDLTSGSGSNGGITFTRMNGRAKNAESKPFISNWHIFLNRDCDRAPGSSPQTPCTIVWTLESQAVAETWIEYVSGQYSKEGMPPVGISKLQYTASGHKYTGTDGTEILFQNKSQGDAFATSMTRKDGVVYTFSYDTSGDPSDGNGDGRLRRVKSNTGYELILEYGGLNGTDKITKACVFNSAVIAPPGAHTCPAGAQTVQYTYESASDRLASITDSMGKLWTITNQFSTLPWTQTFHKPIAGAQTSWLTNTVGSVSPKQRAVLNQQFVDGRTIAYSYENFEPQVPDGALLPDQTARGIGWVENGLASTELSWHVYQQVTQNGVGPQFISPAPVIVSDPLARRTVVDFLAGYFSAHGQVASKALPSGRMQTFAYGMYGVIEEVRWKPASDGDSDLVTSYTYNCTVEFNCPKPLTVTDPRGNTTDYTYSSTHGLMLTETLPDPDGAGPQVRPQKRYSYQSVSARGGGSVSLLAQISECRTTASCAGTAEETVTSFTYPAAASANNLLPVSTTVRAGDNSLIATTSWTYDAYGNKLTEDGPLSGTADTSRWAYDAKRRVTKTMTPDPDGSGPLKPLATVSTYDDAGRLTKQENGTVPNEATNWTSFAASDSVETVYDVLDRKTRESKKSGATTYTVNQYSYDSFGRLECTAVRMNPAAFGSLPTSACTLGAQGSDGPDRITKNSYDLAGQLIKVTEGVGTAAQADEATYTYTHAGKREYLTDARGYKASMVYDGHERQTEWRFPDKVTPGTVSATDYEQYTYDNGGNRLTLKKRDGSTLSFAYDNLNRMVTKVVPGATPSTRDVYLAYDLQGHQTSARFDSGSGEGLTSIYDALGRVTSTALAMDSVTRTFGYQYDIRGIRTSVTHPDSTVITYTPDTLGRLTNLAQGATALRGYSYDGNGRLTASALGSGTPGSTTLGYDTIGRLTGLTHNILGTAADVTFGFTYSPASQTLTHTRDNDSYAWTGAVPVIRNYTTNGLNQYTAAGAATFLYDANGNLTGDGTNSYLYDVENRLVSAAIGGQAVSLRYDPMGRLYEVTGTTTTRFLYDGDELVGEYATTGAMLKRYVHGIAVDDPVIQYEGSGIASTALRHLLADRQGSVIGLADSTGAIVAKNTYDEYGIPKSDQVGQAVVGRFAYTGQIWLPELGMYHYKARLYSPTLGRFLQTDPIGYDDQINLYAYVGNDPMNATDPSGRCSSLSGQMRTKCDEARVAATGRAENYLKGQSVKPGAKEAAYIEFFNVKTGETQPPRTGDEAGKRTNREVQFYGPDGKSRLSAAQGGRVLDSDKKHTDSVVLVTGHGHPKESTGARDLTGVDRGNEGIRNSVTDPSLNKVAPLVLKTPSERVVTFPIDDPRDKK